MKNFNMLRFERALGPTIFLILFLVAPKYGYIDLTVIFLFVAWILYGGAIKWTPEVQIIVISFLMILMLSLVSALVNGVITPDIILKPVRIVLVITILFSILAKSRIAGDVTIDALIFAGAINSIVVLLQVGAGFWGFDDSYLRLFPPGETENSLRKPGLSTGFPSSGLLSCIAAMAAMTLFISKNRNKYLFLAIACYPGIFMSARTAVILFLIGGAFLVVLFLIRKRFIAIFKLVLLHCILVHIFSKFVAGSPDLSELLYIMFEFIYVYQDTGVIGIRSTDDLLENHYFFPRSAMEWFFGNSMPAWSDGGIESDVWFVQSLVGSGIFSTSLYLFAFFYLMFKGLKSLEWHAKIIAIISFSFVFISSFKASFIFSRFVGDTATLLGVWGLAQAYHMSTRE
jgi:hypothetical protein